MDKWLFTLLFSKKPGGPAESPVFGRLTEPVR